MGSSTEKQLWVPGVGPAARGHCFFAPSVVTICKSSMYVPLHKITYVSNRHINKIKSILMSLTPIQHLPPFQTPVSHRDNPDP